MKIRIYSVYGDELIPEAATDGSVGVDVRAPHNIYLPPGYKTVIDSGLVVDVSEFTEAGMSVFTIAAPRSSTGIKKDVFFLNTVGIIDPDYSGCDPESGRYDTISFHLGRRQPMPTIVQTPDGYRQVGTGYENLENFIYKKGERFAQLLFIPYIPGNVEALDLSEVSRVVRGGIGSTGFE